MNESELARFMEKVSVTEGCWRWTGRPTVKGYGRFWLRGKAWMAHIASYEHFVGPVPDDLVLDHIVCSTPICVNPNHLKPVTRGENTLRSETNFAALNAAKTHCDHGHPLSGDNLRVFIGKSGRPNRACRECEAQWRRDATARQKGRAA